MYSKRRTQVRQGIPQFEHHRASVGRAEIRSVGKGSNTRQAKEAFDVRRAF